MESLQKDVNYIENNLTKNFQSQIAVCSSWICSTVWMWVLDTNTEIGENAGWVFTPNFSDAHLTLAGRIMWLRKNCMRTFQRSHKKSGNERLNLVGHCYQHKEEAAAQLIFWRPKHGKKSQDQPAQDFVGTLAWDSGIELENLGACMMDQTAWRGIITQGSNLPWLTDSW